MPQLVVVSHVLPFPGQSGQERRVYYSLQAARKCFEVTFVTFARQEEIESVRSKLVPFCDRAIVLAAKYSGPGLHRIAQRAEARLIAWVKGLKPSNFVLSQVEFTKERLAEALCGRRCHWMLLEYWHAAQNVCLYRHRGVRTVLDMHDVQWRTFELQLKRQPLVPRALQAWRLHRYQAQEEHAWGLFDKVLAINQDEFELVQRCVGKQTEVELVPMGVDLHHWPYVWQPVQPPRICHYGGLEGQPNLGVAEACISEIMPLVWRVQPDCELWLVGNKPRTPVRGIAGEKRIVLTGFVPEVGKLLGTMSAVICPWKGRYGFRSRFVEAMAIGVPVITTEDGMWGMGFAGNEQIVLAGTAAEFAAAIVRILRDRVWAQTISRAGRAKVETAFTVEATYLQAFRRLAASSPTEPIVL